MINQQIFFMGAGHGGKAALRSLLTEFPVLEIVTLDEDLRALARQGDIVHNSITAIEAKFGVMSGHNTLISPELIARKTILNVHYSLLPRYRGMHPVVWALLNLEPEVGLTVHLVDEGMDAGPIIHQHQIVYQNETSWELMQVFDDYVARELGQITTAFLAGRLSPVTQDKRFATWVPRRNIDDCLVNFLWPADRLRAFFRALVRPYPLPAILVRGQRYEISSAVVVERPYFCDVGRVLNVDAEGAWLKCADSLLVVRKLIDSGGVEHVAQGFLRAGMRLMET